MATDWLRDAVTIDFESLPIRERPRHPPAPVGVAVRAPGQRSRYYAWGHPSGNNCSWAEGRQAVAEAYASKRPLLFHNGLHFDLDVAEVHLGLERPPWERVHDTLPALFLKDPRASDFKLKNAAERLLGAKPEERDEVVAWLLEHRPVIGGVKLSKAPKSDNYAGAYVAYAPGDLVGRYACGDVDRTFDLAALVLPELEQRRMWEAYDRERELAYYVLDMERQGLRVDLKRLERDVERYEGQLAALDTWLRRRLKAGDSLNLDSGPQLAQALIKAKLAVEDDFGYTEKGSVQTNKAALAGAVQDKQVLAALRYRTQLGTCLHTFMRPWCATAQTSGGFIFTEWHSTRTDRGAGGVGARTGRFSSTPNFQNLPKEFTVIFRDRGHPELPAPPVALEPLPLVRSYVIPYQQGDVLLDRDYSQQEPRILAHFEGGALLEAYQANPRIDFHTTVQEQLAARGLVLDRKPVKIINLGLIYGMGLGKLAEGINRSIEETKQIKAAIMALYPGLADMYAEMKRRAKVGEPIRTWGGREYFCEEPQWVDGRLRTYDYKLVNVLVQGSAADCTKAAVIRYCRRKPAHHRLLLLVHDQTTVSAPKREHKEAMALLREAMEGVPFEVQMLSEGSWSSTNWAGLEDYPESERKVA